MRLLQVASDLLNVSPASVGGHELARQKPVAPHMFAFHEARRLPKVSPFFMIASLISSTSFRNPSEEESGVFPLPGLEPVDRVAPLLARPAIRC